MTVVVTGGCGFIGSHLVRRLLRDEHTVSILDTFYTGHPSNLGDCYPECSVIQGSVTNWDAVRRAMSGCHMVYHLAARMDWSKKPRHAAALVKTNVMGTTWVLTMARAMGVQRVVFTSSASVYGSVFPGIEGGPCLPVSTYGSSKLAAEAICRGFNVTGLEVVVLRLFNVHGIGGHGVVEAFKGGGNIVYGDGAQTRDFVHVSDVVNALIGAQGWYPTIYNVGTGNETTISGLWHKLRGDKFGDEEPQYIPSSTGGIDRSYADLDKVGQVWKAKRGLVK